MKINGKLVIIIKTILILSLTILLAFVLDMVGLESESILMIYVVGVLIVIVETKNFLCGAISALFCVISFNYFFTEPKYTFMVDDPNYFASFIIFLVVAFLVSSLTTRLQKQIAISKKNEQIANELYQISSGFLNITGMEQIAVYGQNSIQQLINKPAYIWLNNIKNSIDNEAIQWCFLNASNCGFRESNFTQDKYKYIPLKNGHKTIGVLAVDCGGKELTNEEILCINTVLSQIMMAEERMILTAEQEQNRLNIEKEKLKNNLLRSISHDLRTPLTGILGSAEFMIESIENLDRGTIISLLEGIRYDSDWLGNMVENLLNMTRIQDGKLMIKKEYEVVDEIISAAIARISRNTQKHIIRTLKPKEVMLVPMDRHLIIQVLVNLLDNALKHTNDNSEIILSAYHRGKDIVFEVTDNGGGIRNDVIHSMFDSFVTSDENKGDEHRGMGLGLSICKSVIMAHGGDVTAFNNDKGGATFQFTLPLEVDKDE